MRDRVRGAAGATLRAYVHFAPDLDVEEQGGAVEIRGQGLRLRLRAVGVDQIVVVRGREAPPLGWHCPRFGVRIPTSTVELRVSANEGEEFGFDLHSADADRPA